MENKIKRVIFPKDIKGKTLEEQIQSIYEKIGQYLINSSEELSRDINENVLEIELNIKIPWDYAVTLEKKVNYLVLDENR